VCGLLRLQVVHTQLQRKERDQDAETLGQLVLQCHSETGCTTKLVHMAAFGAVSTLLEPALSLWLPFKIFQVKANLHTTQLLSRHTVLLHLHLHLLLWLLPQALSVSLSVTPGQGSHIHSHEVVLCLLHAGVL
jgi:hypothetical protein